MAGIDHSLRNKQTVSRKRIFGDVTPETDRLLLGEADDEKEILSKIGLNHVIKREEAKRAPFIKIEEYKKRFEGKIKDIDNNIVNCNTIKEIGKDYYLKIVRSDYYEGELPDKITEKLKKFFSQFGDVLKSIDKYSKHIFILTDEANIKGESKSKNPYMTIFLRLNIEDYANSTHKWHEVKEKDVFVKIATLGDIYRPFRKFKEFFSEVIDNPLSAILFFITVIAIIIGLINNVFIPFYIAFTVFILVVKFFVYLDKQSFKLNI